MQKRRSNKISILIVPEDDSEPYSFRIKTRYVKLLYVAGVILLAHIIIGAIFYWKYADLFSYNEELIANNTQLKEDNRRVLVLTEKFHELEQNYQKVKSLLGVESRYSDLAEAEGERQQSPVLVENIVPAVRREIEVLPESQSRFFYTRRKQAFVQHSDYLPALLPVKGFITQDFQRDRLFGPRHHSGIDIVAKKGTVIRSAGSGRVIFANWSYVYGNLIIIDHGNGFLTYYGHNQRLLKGEKSYVRRGEPIALLGNSGKSSGPHLHFEIWKDGKPVDPKEYLLTYSENITTSQ
jgi:murein DD-endopeptidase MepM/ murein hydrolase activator NlpD